MSAPSWRAARQLTWPRVRPARDKLDALLAAALAAVEPGQAVRRALSASGDGGRLSVGGRELQMRDFRRLILVGAGKASAPMAAAVEDTIGDALPIEGSVMVRYGHAAPTRYAQIREASHPVPDAAGVAGTRAIAELLAGADERDLVMCVISGGGSSLLTLPTDRISLEDLQRTTDALLRSGASINEINMVRKHLDRVKGGGLARLAAPAQVVSLVLSDVVGNPLDAIASGPTVPDTSTWTEAGAVFDRYALWPLLPRSAVERVRSGLGGQLPDTPKAGDPLFAHTQTVGVGSTLLACVAAASTASATGLGRR